MSAANACLYCVAAWGECWDPERHTSVVQRVAHALAVAVQETPTPTDEQVGQWMEDAAEIAHDWPDDTAVTLRDLGFLGDDRRHFEVNGERWASPDPNAEGFNPCERMAPCPFEHDEDGCYECHGAGWVPLWMAEQDNGRGEA